MDDWGKVKEDHLPPIESFYIYRKLKLLGPSDCDYDHAQRVWTEFEMKNLGDCHNLYVDTTNVLLLCNIFETFRITCLEHYDLSLAHFYTSDGLDWC